MTQATAPTILRPENARGPAPTLCDYYRGGTVTVLVGALLIDAIVFSQEDLYFTVQRFLLGYLLTMIVGASAALSLGGPCVALIHRRMQRVLTPWIHVVTFGAIGAVLSAVTILVLSLGDGETPFVFSAGLVGATTFATALGRLSMMHPLMQAKVPVQRSN